MQIAPGIENTEWNALDLSTPVSTDWIRAVEILQTRIEARYIEAVDSLIATDDVRSPHLRRLGFSILAIDSLLIEAFQSFIEGDTDPRYMSALMFRTFMTTRPSFNAFFNTPQLADMFYTNFRCGILHQAEIQGDCTVWSVGPLMEMRGAGMRITRTAFHNALKQESGDYLTVLRNGTILPMRDDFRRKMDFIAR